MEAELTPLKAAQVSPRKISLTAEREDLVLKQEEEEGGQRGRRKKNMKRNCMNPCLTDSSLMEVMRMEVMKVEVMKMSQSTREQRAKKEKERNR